MLLTNTVQAVVQAEIRDKKKKSLSTDDLEEMNEQLSEQKLEQQMHGDARYRADLEAGLSPYQSLRKYKSRMRAATHRASRQAERARLHLEAQDKWHRKYDKPSDASPSDWVPSIKGSFEGDTIEDLAAVERRPLTKAEKR